MTLFQSTLGWIYLFLCLVMVWYFVSLLLYFMQWLRRQVQFRKLGITFAKLVFSLVVTRAVIWFGTHFSHL